MLTYSANYIKCYIVYDGVIVISAAGETLYSAEYGLPVLRIDDPPRQ